jgi:AraC family chitin signaling transcriptional activator
MKVIPGKLSNTSLLLYIFVILSPLHMVAQELPPMLKFNSAVYEAGNQNWMIAQDRNHYMYFANNEGLLEYNGSDWSLYPSPNETIIRSVKVIDDRIYTGCYMEFGYWQRQRDGRLAYTSLSKSIQNKILDDEQFWNILQYDHWVVFQSLNRIYIFDSKANNFKIITPKSAVNRAFIVNRSIYFQTVDEGLFEIANGKSVLISAHPVVMNNKIVGMSSDQNGLLLHTQFNGFYRLKDGIASKWTTEADKELEISSIYSSQVLSDGGIALGCVSNGVFILSKEGQVRYHITQNKGLGNNTALSLFEDAYKNLWIGLDNGISCLNLRSAVRSLSDDRGVLGTVYTSIEHNGKLYIGTNQGLFSRDQNASGDFSFIPGTKGQVWSLFAYEGTLFCGHDTGTYIVGETTAHRIFKASGTWKFSAVPGQRDRLLQGNYYGISVLERSGGTWQFRNKLHGFDYSSKYFEINTQHQILVSHEYKGVYKIQADRQLQKATSVTKFTDPPKGKNAGLAKFNGRIYYAYKDGVFVYEPKSSRFVKEPFLSEAFSEDVYTTGKMQVDHSENLWLFTKNYISFYSIGRLSSELKRNAIPIPSSITNSMSGYENITQISSSHYLIGTTDGYYTLNIDDLTFNNYLISITAVLSSSKNSDANYAEHDTEGKFKYAENNITFNYTVPEYNKYINTEYQYQLSGVQDEWSPWSTRTSVNFKNLPSDKYEFKVRAKIGNSFSENIATYRFTVLKPWYRTHLAILAYLILLLIAAHFIHKAYRNYYQKQKEKLIEENNRLLEIKELENEQQLMKIKNQQLSQDVDNKNRELAVSTMSLIQKNELLTLIKEDLKKTDEAGNRNIKSVISTINKNISEEDTWNIFKEAFNNADKDFLKKVKALHPSLTPNDLRLCAYLRLNLSSKEIAPLLNISVRSVEIKRYRLRKKMDLDHEQGLVEYILAI